MPAVDPLLLAIDTSTEVAGLALYDGDRISEMTWAAGRNQTATVLGEIQRLLAMNGRQARDVAAVGVATGPGSFNGLRVGMSVAKGLALGFGLPLVGVVTLDAVAYPHARARMPIRAFVAAGRGRVVYADYRHRNGRWVRQSEMRNAVLDQLAEGLTERTILVGEVPVDSAERLEEHALVTLPSPALRLRRPSYLAEIAYRRWQQGDVDRLEALEPVYVHGGAST
ncbi:MAG TPA: tRNA (adenosine(37)-N6)-threonylcarbamoyltransferase complex dimerization subunit type 1 TsaB [Thermomicrobiaceae bacterium]|nr:tRNA (adenosine(37)-N6)-threonylcarbamoyltransferase complex dimerization subunit type 1 TsaB [Thermomicrobiaceae bacterium]